MTVGQRRQVMFTVGRGKENEGFVEGRMNDKSAHRLPPWKAPWRAERLQGTPKVECHEDVVSLDVVTEEPFKGNIFVKGKAKDPACMRHFDSNGQTYASYSMQLGRCGMQRLRSANPRGMNFVITVIISFHEKFITQYDRAFHIRCFYMEPDEVVSSSLEVSALPTTVLTHKMEMPKCEYTVRRDSPNGPLVTFAEVGDTVFHVWDCHGPDMGMMVKKCFVTDGKGEDHAVLDSDGCSTDTFLLTELTYDIDLMKAHAQSQVFKYADTNQLYFTCQIRLCQKQMGLCQGVTPPRCSSSQGFGNDSQSENSTRSHRSRRSPIITSKRLTEVQSV
uniref:ZP domain-containing protein n=1 Tax=Plectus sambesii TaxID=2011161 RepID=A0A914V3S2_9BILA